MSSPRHAPRVPFALLVTALIVGGLVLLLALNTASAANELKRHDLATQDQRIAAQVQQLRIDVALSSAPGNIARAAAELGMVPAGNPAFIVVAADGSVKVLGKPKAVQDVPVAIAPAPTTAHATPTPATTSAAPKPAPKSASKSTSTSTTKAAGAKSTGAKKSTGATATRSSSATPKRTPASTPTPTLTLPGGQR